jgi:hypothetical protein
VAWGIGVAGLAVLLARFPCSTWPEQVGLVGALFGAAVVGQWWVGLAAWGVARLVWLAERALQARRSSAAA